MAGNSIKPNADRRKAGRMRLMREQGSLEVSSMVGVLVEVKKVCSSKYKVIGLTKSLSQVLKNPSLTSTSKEH